MKRTFQMEDLDCAQCAARMETAIERLPGVRSAAVCFMTQKLTIEADEEAFDGVVKAAVKTCRKIEPDCTILV